MRRILVALVTLAAFGCTTVRVPVSSLEEELAPVSGAIAEPQVELWLESGKLVAEAELEEARQQVRAALDTALAGREVAPDALGAADPLLLVRARAVARTASRRTDQRTATAAAVVGLVVVIAAVIVIVIVSRDAPKSGPRVAKARPAAAPRVAAPVRALPAPRNTFRPAPAPGRHLPAPAPWAYRAAPSHRPHVWLGFELLWLLPPPPYAIAPDDWARDEWVAEGAAPPPAAEPEPVIELAVPPLPDLSVTTRGFFAGDETVLEVDLFDRGTGALLWTKVVRDDVDPRDARAMTRLLDRALAKEPWIRPARILRR